MTSRGLLGECPICHKTFSVQRLPAHVDLCLDQQQDEPAEQQQNSLPVVVVKQKRKDSAAPAAVVSEGRRFFVSPPFVDFHFFLSHTQARLYWYLALRLLLSAVMSPLLLHLHRL